MVKIREAIVVEGRYDKNTLCQIVDAPILETAGTPTVQDLSSATISKVPFRRNF